MRRCVALAFLLLLAWQSGGVSFAGPQSVSPRSGNLGPTVSGSHPAVAVTGPRSPQVRHTPVPRRPMADYASRRRYARLIPKPDGTAKIEHIARPIDLVKLRHEHQITRTPAARNILFATPRESTISAPATKPQEYALHRPGPLGRQKVRPAQLSPSVTGIWPWWTYQTRSIPWGRFRDGERC